MLEHRIRHGRPRDPFVANAPTVGEDQLLPCPVDCVAGEVHLVLEITAAELTGRRVARPMGAPQHDRNDVRHDEVHPFMREEPGAEIHGIRVSHATRSRSRKRRGWTGEEVTGHPLELDAGVGHDLPAICADRTVAVLVPPALPRAVTPQRQPRPRRQTIVVRHDHPHADGARCSVRPQNEGAVRLGREDKRAARWSRDGRPVRRDLGKRQRAERSRLRLQDHVGRDPNLEPGDAWTRRYNLVGRGYGDLRRVLRVDERHPHSEWQHSCLAPRQWQTVIERPVCLARCVRRRPIHEDDLVTGADLGEQEAAGVIGERRAAADPHRHVGQRLAVEAQHLARERRHAVGRLQRRQVLPARVRLAVTSLPSPLLVVRFRASAAIRPNGGRVRVLRAHRPMRVVATAVTDATVADLGREVQATPRRRVAVGVGHAVNRQRVLRAGRQWIVRRDEYQRPLLRDDEGRRLNTVRPVKRHGRRRDGLQL